MKLLLDENLPPRLARSLGVLFEGEHLVQHIVDKFQPGLADEEWIEALGKEGSWCVLSGDRRIATKKPSRDLFLRSNLIDRLFPEARIARSSSPGADRTNFGGMAGDGFNICDHSARLFRLGNIRFQVRADQLVTASPDGNPAPLRVASMLHGAAELLGNRRKLADFSNAARVQKRYREAG